MREDQLLEIVENLPSRISDVVKPWAVNTPDQPALVEATGAWTYGKLAKVIAETKDWLNASGVRPGDRVMILCENCRAFVAIWLAAIDLNAWPVLVNSRLSAQEVDQIRDHCGARLLIYMVNASVQAREHAKRHGASIYETDDLGQVGHGPLNERAEPEPIGDGEIPGNVAALIYTSGTTGVPKGVMLTHRGLLFIAGVSARLRGLIPRDRLMGVLPMSHAVGLSTVLLGTLLSGATLYLYSRFDPMSARAAIEKDKLTVVLGVPAMFGLLLEYAKRKGLKSLTFPTLRIISSSGAPLAQATKEGIESLLGMVLHNGYGVTECSPTIALTRIESPRSDISVGTVFPGIEIKLVGSDRSPVAEGKVGELWVRGPSVMKGYYRAPEETAAAIDREGWFNTRDLARLENGSLFIVGRTKELIVHFGFNVYPAEVEAVLSSHPAVARSAVVGRPVEGDEEVIAYIEILPGSSVAPIELEEYAARHLAPYKRPSKIILVPSMPLTPTGKVMKDKLEKMASNNIQVV
jgi:long-chain acyl-CoA synthetase